LWDVGFLTSVKKRGLMASLLFLDGERKCKRVPSGVRRLRAATIPQSASLPAACGQSGRGSGCPPDSHSLPRLRFAYPLHKGAFGLLIYGECA